jgi:NADH-quinone oxidoreductase subunit G
MEGTSRTPPPPLQTFLWAPGWNSVQALQSRVADRLHESQPGVRLIEPRGNGKAGYFRQVPPAFAPRSGQWLLVPLYCIFGSEELSALAPALASRAPEPYLTMHVRDAVSLGVAEGEQVEIQIDTSRLRLPVRLSQTVPEGVAGLACGLVGSNAIALPAWGTVSR